MTLAELEAATFRRLAESTTSPIFWTSDDVRAALNRGYAEITDETEWRERSRTITLLNARPWYDLRTVIGPDVLSIGAAFDQATNRWMEPAVVSQLDGNDRRWEVVTGEPRLFMVHSLWWLGYWPRVSGDDVGGPITQYFTSLPETLEDDDDAPGFPETFHDGLVDYAVSDLWALDAEAAFALDAWGRYVAVEAALAAWVQARATRGLRRGYGVFPGRPA